MWNRSFTDLEDDFVLNRVNIHEPKKEILEFVIWEFSLRVPPWIGERRTFTHELAMISWGL